MKNINSKNKNIILSFDLDYTLIDNTEGILNSFKYALEKYNLPKLDDYSIKKMIGIPLNEMFSKVSDFDPLLLSASFREYYAKEGIYQVRLFPGIVDKLNELKNNFLLGVITSKKETMAIKLLRYLNLDYYFEYIIGECEKIKSKLDSRLKFFLLSKYPKNEFVIIGDHPKDRMLSEMLNCPFIGVLTGHHSKDQLIGKNIVRNLILDSVVNISIRDIYSLFDFKYNNIN